ncbi:MULTISPECIES: 4Fe-4S binding protein [unclassified Helicobacter]|uniref:4Fe-4S binding protein n=1 Tax=unclassified Helicobacter TaxID=2593540 RepID=UPI000CF19BA1|nr:MULTISPECIES: 4Fe-4S binding protein [unclassified Helicobacter]
MLPILAQKFDASKQDILRKSLEISEDYSDFFHFYSIEVKPRVLILGDGLETEDFALFLRSYKPIKYEVKVLSPKEIQEVGGYLGNFEISTTSQEKLYYSQIVLFYEDENLKRFMGCESVEDYESPEDLIKVLDSKIGEYSYHNVIHYNPDKCQYHHRRPNKQNQGYCHSCVDVCPTFGVSKNDTLMELHFSALDCISCGACVMVCPSGAIQRDGYSKEAIFKIAKLYKDIVPLVVASKEVENIKNLDFHKSLPLVIIQPHLLNEVYLLSIIQESGSQIVLFDREKNERLQKSVELINEIFERIYQKRAIFLVQDEQFLQEAISQADIQEEFFYTYHQDQKEELRHIFSERLRFMVKDRDFGEIQTTGNTYGEVYIDKEKCTLCMGCIGACNVQSLSTGDFSLLHNPSLCTTCNYCVDSCPENAISTNFGVLRLQENWFSNNVMAKDTGFRCVECGKVFATTKSIEKIKNMMLPLFGDDKKKIRSLECCETCKVKVMFGA